MKICFEIVLIHGRRPPNDWQSCGTIVRAFTSWLFKRQIWL